MVLKHIEHRRVCWPGCIKCAAIADGARSFRRRLAPPPERVLVSQPSEGLGRVQLEFLPLSSIRSRRAALTLQWPAWVRQRLVRVARPSSWATRGLVGLHDQLRQRECRRARTWPGSDVQQESPPDRRKPLSPVENLAVQHPVYSSSGGCNRAARTRGPAVAKSDMAAATDPCQGAERVHRKYSTSDRQRSCRCPCSKRRIGGASVQPFGLGRLPSGRDTGGSKMRRRSFNA